jgi:hypothetical protein
MRKQRWVATVALGFAAWGALALPAGAARRDPPWCEDKPVSGEATSQVPPTGTSSAGVCDGGTGAADVSVTASMNPSTGHGYAVYQGRRGDAVPEGYVGADTQNGATVVGCATGTYDPEARDEWNQSPDSTNNNAQIALGTDEFTAPTGPVGPGDPCSPFVPHTPPGRSCGSPQDAEPDAKYPGGPSPLNVYSSNVPPNGADRAGDVGVAGDFGGGDGASGDLQASYTTNGPIPTGNVTTGGNSRGGGGTVAVGNDGNETDDPYTPNGSP